MPNDIIHRFHTALPQVRDWIDQFLDSHKDRTRPVSTFGLKRLSTYFPQDLLDHTKVVSVDRVQFPPVESFGLPELAHIQTIPIEGITFKNTVFLQQSRASEELHFHELVHVVQWSRLGVDNFLLAYGFGLLSDGYEQSPLEQMAYTLQHDFENETLPDSLIAVIEQRTDAIWEQVVPIIYGHLGGA